MTAETVLLAVNAAAPLVLLAVVLRRAARIAVKLDASPSGLTGSTAVRTA